MEFDLSIFAIAVLLSIGLIAGCLNTLAGGGSLITLPALIALGLPADIANATNRLGIFAQSITGAKGFDYYGRLDRAAVLSLAGPIVSGSIVGALMASYMPVWLLEPILLSAMIGVALLLVLKPELMGKQKDNDNLVSQNTFAGFWLFLTGIYGGFVHAGIGFILIAVLAGSLRYDLVRANALKVVFTALFSLVAILIFTLREQIWWIPGLILAAGSFLGAVLGVRFTLRLNEKTLKWILLIMVFCLSLYTVLD
ncbi:sulfite exporter TauE/SafE family protein [Gammaproteobacteria bacterium]|nr:sulfite exporter TauE/SafE family protein [Gammaproteobacteria bacterium]